MPLIHALHHNKVYINKVKQKCQVLKLTLCWRVKSWHLHFAELVKDDLASHVHLWERIDGRNNHRTVCGQLRAVKLTIVLLNNQYKEKSNLTPQSWTNSDLYIISEDFGIEILYTHDSPEGSYTPAKNKLTSSKGYSFLCRLLAATFASCDVTSSLSSADAGSQETRSCVRRTSRSRTTSFASVASCCSVDIAGNSAAACPTSSSSLSTTPTVNYTISYAYS